jgi:glutaredoxin-like YruB-family protein
MAKVTVYSTTWCPWCTRAKDFLKQNKVAFKDVNVENNPSAAQELAEKSGQMGVPVIEIDGKIIIGFNEPEIRKALKL